MLIKDIPLIWPLSMFPSKTIHWVSYRPRLRVRLQRVAFYFFVNGYPVRVYTLVTETYPMCDDPPQDRITRIRAALYKPPTSNMRRVLEKKGLVLRAPVRKNGTYCFKGGQFDFFYIFMENRLRYN